ncbi:hypothetical protein HYPBUDRAFT_109294 [Hyphopichia burtonii NRRL Y-1933]|uniref:Uncharacterized protein n=1 Tax=Hyphopichia burtonii NRRL Y-1933 TaxID=984485 RepID=A0A1E4RIA8_9ASCO|nr:hypothetical protein HYPBUDRAFT_109294 [Hyphopichia burtonii NRRL Y-1933]ODV67004.1 hypothetical protein HYPBUDRAFT_109294 [Hyphopichia burtonii NRRL Y-1933]
MSPTQKHDQINENTNNSDDDELNFTDEEIELTPSNADIEFLSKLKIPNESINNLKKQNLVILARSGLKVHKSISFFNSGFEKNESLNHQADETTSLLHPPSTSSISRASSLAELYHYYRDYLKDFFMNLPKNEIFISVFKCSIAYLLASLGVYWTPFNNFLGKTDSKHVVATVAVYFHPARSKGSMHQTLIFVVISLLFSFIVSFGCRSLSTFWFNKGEDEVSYIIDLILSSIGLGLIAFMKQKVNKATFNTACSLASISVVTCIIKEASLNSSSIPLPRLISTAKVVVVGSAISVACCYILWPTSAVDQLRSSLNDSYNIMSLVLSVIANHFLMGQKLNSKDVEIFNTLKKNTTQLKKNLEEAKYELNLKGREEELKVYNDLVNTTIALSRHLQALRSSAEMQWQLLHENSPNIPKTPGVPSMNSTSGFNGTDSQVSSYSYSQNNQPSPNSNLDYTAVNSAQLFDLFVYYLAPSIKSFVFTLKGVLAEIPFEKSFENDLAESNDQNKFRNISELLSRSKTTKFTKSSNFQQSLNKAIDLFQSKQVESFSKLYSQDIFKSDNFDLKADQEEITACCGNFASLLVLYGKELIKFLKITEHHEHSKSSPKSWNWLKIWKFSNDPSKSNYLDPKSNDSENDDGFGATLNEALINLQSQYRTHNHVPKTRSRRKLDNYSYELWKALKVFRRTDVQFGIRVGLGAFCLSFFAFYPKTKEVFNNWRGEWALVIYCIMMNKSVGGTTMTVKWRFIGTFLGASSAYITWMCTDGNAYALALIGYLISIPSFYIIIHWKRNNPFGRFILLTYNLTALYSYSMTQQDSEDDNEGGENPLVEEIAFHRFIAVSIGIVWALIMASCFLPNSARARLKSGLTILWLRMGVIWNSDPLDYTKRIDEDGEEIIKLIGLKDEKGINDLLAECEVLLKQAPLEFRLKGSFPESTYRQLITRSSAIIDAFQNMNLMVEVDPFLSRNEEFVINYIALERAEVEHRIFLIFYMIASAMKLGFPLPSKPASTQHAKDRLLYKLNEIRSESASNPNHTLTNEDYVFMYSYILVTSVITRELDEIIELIKDLLGDITVEIFQLV